MVVRGTDTRDFGLASGWADEDGTTTTYHRFARAAAGRKRIPTAPVTRAVTPAVARPARSDAYARRPSGVQPKITTDEVDLLELLELDEQELHDNPFARRSGAASASLWSTLAFAALFASVLIGRVIVHTSQEQARDTRPTAAAVGAQNNRNATEPSAPSTGTDHASDASSTPSGNEALEPSRAGAGGATGLPGSYARSAAPELSPTAASPADSDPPGSASAPEAQLGQRSSASPADSTSPGSARTTQSQSPSGPADPSLSTARSAAVEPTNRSGRAALSGNVAPSAAERGNGETGATRTSRTRGAPPRAAVSSDWRDGPMEPATSSFNPNALTPAALGTLRINSRPWSQVFIDGRLIGNTPQMSVPIAAGRHTVRLENPELGMSKTVIVHVTAGEIVTRVESLE